MENGGVSFEGLASCYQASLTLGGMHLPELASVLWGHSWERQMPYRNFKGCAMQALMKGAKANGINYLLGQLPICLSRVHYPRKHACACQSVEEVLTCSWCF